MQNLLRCKSVFYRQIFEFVEQRFLAPFSFTNLSRTLSNSVNISPASSLVSAINSCSSLPLCKKIHAQIIKSVNFEDEYIGDRLVVLYTKLGLYEHAHNLFDEMPNKDLVSWNSLISGFSRKAEVSWCLSAFYRMKLEMGIEPNEVTLVSVVSVCTDAGMMDEGNYIHGFAVKMGLILNVKVANSFINMYGKFGCVDLAMQLFDSITEQSLISWNSIIMIYVKNRLFVDALDMFNRMRRDGFRPDQATMVTLIQGCGNVGIGKLAESMHGFILNAGLDQNFTIATAILSVYAKLGKLNAANAIFTRMNNGDRIAWTAMIGGYAMHGCGREAIELFELMIKGGVIPDRVTFTHLLSACSHSGLVNEGKKFFSIMTNVYGIEPRPGHYSCMVDLLGRAAHLDEAYDLIKSMPMEPNHGVWGAFLNACRVHKNIELGKEAAERLIALNPSDCRNYLMLSSLYFEAGHWKDASRVRALMKERGVVQSPGHSSMEYRSKW